MTDGVPLAGTGNDTEVSDDRWRRRPPPTGSALADAHARFQAGLRGRYTLERELGRGGTAIVFLARDVKHGRMVALKLLLSQIAATLGPDRFHREVEIAARLQHPHILTVLDSGETAGQYWFTMPYVEGRSLRDWLRRELQLPVADAVQIAREAAAALTYAHEHGVIHRDIKPENILLTSHGEVLVADFGIARALGGDGPLTPTGMAVGTPAYMSPEQASGGSIDRRTDLYSLGCVLYEMLAGEPPYTGPTAQAIAAKHLSGPVPSVCRTRPSVPTAVDRVIQRVLAPVPADRFGTAAEFSHALQPIAATLTMSPGAGLASARVAPASIAPGWEPARALRFMLSTARRPGLALLLSGAALLIWSLIRAGTAAGPAPTRLAVLPFENLGDSADAYFADGITDELRGKLATVRGLEVVAGKSSNEYRQTTKGLTEIARDLGVQYVLVGKIRRQRGGRGPGRVRVSPELIQVTARGVPTTRWAQPFDTGLADVVGLQVVIADRVSQLLNLTPAARVLTGAVVRPTASTEAYDYYLRGNEHYALETIPDAQLSIQLYQRAIGLDSSFALAWARLSRALAFMYWFGGDRSVEQLARIERTARRSLALAPDLPEAHVAMGYYAYWGRRDYLEALKEFAAAAKREPNNAEVVDVVGLVMRRQGRWDEALAGFARAAELDPRSAGHWLELAQTYFLLRRYQETHLALDRAAALAPDSPDVYAIRMATYLNSEGSLEGPRRVMREALTRFQFARFGGAHMFGDCFDLIASDAAYQDDVARLTPAAFNGVPLGYFAFKASVYRRRGDLAQSRVYADSARREALAVIRRREDDLFTHAVLAIESAYLGRAGEAVEAAERAIGMLPQSKDAVFAPEGHIALAEVQMALGNTDAALDQVEAALAVPSYLSPGRLRGDPLWASLKANPRFEQLIARNEALSAKPPSGTP
jgi:serine/threonine-protein kinase